LFITNLNDFQGAIRFYNEALNTLKPYFESNPDIWIGDFMLSLLNNLGVVHDSLNDFQGAIRFYNETLNILKPYFENNPDRWIEDLCYVVK
jgi:tetratricopeptide (TPR) repeat protein